MTYNIGKIHKTQYSCHSKRYHDKKTILLTDDQWNIRRRRWRGVQQ